MQTADVVRESSKLFRTGLGAAIVFSLVLAVIRSLLLSPVAVWAFYTAIAMSGSRVITNIDMVGFFLSWQGILASLIWVIMTCSLMTIEFGGLTITFYERWQGKKTHVKQTLSRVLLLLPKLVGKGIFKLCAFYCLVVPVVFIAVASLTTAVLGIHNKNVLRISGDLLAAGGIWVVIGCLIALFFLAPLLVRWGFVLHALCLEKKTLTEAFVRSRDLTEGKRKFLGKIILSAISIQVAVILVVGLATSMIMQLTVDMVSSWEDLNSIAVAITIAAVIQSLVLICLTQLLIIFSFAMINVLYNGCIHEGNIEPPEQTASDEHEPEIPNTLWKQPIVIMGLGLVLLAIGSIITIPATVRAMEQSQKQVLVTAHRGSSILAPENSMAAFQLAIDQKADFIEFDVQEAKDGELVVFHDKSLKRVTGDPRSIWEVTGAEMRTLDNGSFFTPPFPKERVPSFEDVIKLADGKIRLNIEIKIHGREQRTADGKMKLVDPLLKIIEKHDFYDQCIVTSLDMEVLKLIREREPKLILGMIMSAKVGDPWSLDVDLYSVPSGLVNKEFVTRAHQMGRQVHVWTFSHDVWKDSLEEIVDMLVDSVIIDDPVMAHDFLDSRTDLERMQGAILRYLGQ